MRKKIKNAMVIHGFVPFKNFVLFGKMVSQTLPNFFFLIFGLPTVCVVIMIIVEF